MTEPLAQDDLIHASATGTPVRPKSQGASSMGRWIAIILASSLLMIIIMFSAGFGPQVIGYIKQGASMLFQPVAFLFVVAMGVEYLVLKSADRTRLLQIELDRLRRKRRNEITTLRVTRESLEAMAERLRADEPERTPCIEKLEKIIDAMRPPEARMIEHEDLTSQSDTPVS